MVNYFKVDWGYVINLTPSKKYLKLSHNRYILVSDLLNALKPFTNEKIYNSSVNSIHRMIRVFNPRDSMIKSSSYETYYRINNFYDTKYNKICFEVGCNNFSKKDIKKCILYLRKNKIKI